METESELTRLAGVSAPGHELNADAIGRLPHKPACTPRRTGLDVEREFPRQGRLPLNEHQAGTTAGNIAHRAFDSAAGSRADGSRIESNSNSFGLSPFNHVRVSNCLSAR